MSNVKNNKIVYSRLLESVLVHKLKLFGAVVIEGPKQTGKTYLGKKIAKSHYYVQKRYEVLNLDLNLDQTNKILNGAKPRLIDEWQIESQIYEI